MARYYSTEEMARLYGGGERMTFSRGATLMTAETAARFAYGLVELDHATGKYRRMNADPGMETAIINEQKFREQLLSSPLYTGNRPAGLR
jgi:uncharacterized protein GlcG (DUF336 family)